jgi:MFS family permease
LLSQEFGLGDSAAGTAFAVFGILCTVYGLFLGYVIDRLGVKRSLLISYTVSFASRLAISLTRSTPVMLFFLYCPLPCSLAMGIPVLTIGIKRCTHKWNRGVAFGLFYTSMNVASLLSFLIADAFRPNHLRAYVIMGAVSAALAALCCVAMRDGVCVDENSSKRKHSDAALGEAAGRTTPPPLPGYIEVIRTARFLKYLTMTLMMVNLKSIFRHLDATLPKYMARAFCAKPGGISAINPACVIVLVPLVAASTTKVRAFDAIRHGSWVSALSPVWLAFVQARAMPALFVLMLSVGEAVWSPRWYDYSMAMAPTGREGAFTALAAAPLFFANLETGFLSGGLLSAFCPAPPPSDTRPPCQAVHCNGRPVWGIITAVTLLSPIGVFVGRNWLRPAEAPLGAEVLAEGLELQEGLDDDLPMGGGRGSAAPAEQWEGAELDAPLLRAAE